jgi:hypothetical protein
MATPVPQAIIVAGFDYQGGGVSFLGLAQNRQKRLLAANSQMTVTIMDVAAGTITISAMIKNDKDVLVRTVIATTPDSPVSAANYSLGLGHHPKGGFDTHPAGRMSITDLYDSIRSVGASKDTKGSLTEVSIFSHGFYQGPILVNTNDSNPGGAARDPDDKDARALKDFKPPNMTPAQLADFRAAFASGARWWNWGCAFTSSYRQVTARFIASPLYRRTPPGKLKDTDKITFEFPQDMADSIYGDDVTFFPQETKVNRAGATVKKTLKFERTVKEIKEFFMRGVADSYGNMLAKASGVPVSGAFLGTYADYEQADKSIKLPLMAVPRSVKIYGTDFTRYINMWVKVLGFKTDPEGHGYGVYPP